MLARCTSSLDLHMLIVPFWYLFRTLLVPKVALGNCYQLLPAPPFLVVLDTCFLPVASCYAFSRRVGYPFLTSCLLLHVSSSCWLHICYQLLPAPPFLVVLDTRFLPVASCSAFSRRVGDHKTDWLQFTVCLTDHQTGWL